MKYLNQSKLIDKRACNEGLTTFVNAHGHKDATWLEAFESNGWDDIWWAIESFYNELSPSQQKDLRLLAADYAERALPLFESEFPSDERPKLAIRASRASAKDLISKSELQAAKAAAKDAAEAAWAAKDVAKDAAEAAAEAAEAAAWAARAAAEAAAWAARAAAWAAEAAEAAASAASAARAAARAAAWAAAKDVAEAAAWAAAWDAAWAAELHWQEQKLAEMLRTWSE